MTRRSTIAAAALAAAVTVLGCVDTAAGTEAPPFALRTLDGSEAIESSALFAEYGHVFLVFWSGGCPHCVEALRGAQAFFRRYGGPDVTVAGVNADEGDLLALRRTIETNGISFRQLRDPGGIVSGAYGVPFETLVIVHVAGGAVAGTRTDPEGAIDATMEEMLLGDAAPFPDAPETAGTGAAPAAGTEDENGKAVFGSSIRGWSRIRFLDIDSRGEDAAGLYGEPVRPGGRIDYRVEIEASKRVAAHLRAGALLRISSEGDRVLESGPKYLGSPLGSAFAEIDAAAFTFRLGYYSMYMTPLTLMRWDWDDNPRVGGDAGCGCGAAAGTLLVESLDDLAPELTFEGALAAYAFFGGEIRAFYAIPRRARETPRGAWITGAEERARYSLELYGAEWRWQRVSPFSGTAWKLGARYVGSREFRHSVDFVELGYPAFDPWWESGIATVSFEAPLAGFVRARAEGVVWNRATQYGRGASGDTIAFRDDGRAGVAGVVFDGPRGASLAIDYLLFDPGFFAPFAALSYEPNREGYRAAARAPLARSRVDADLFYKRVLEHTPLFGAERAVIETSGISITGDLGGGFGATAGWIEESDERGGEVFPYSLSRRAVEAGLQFGFAKSGVVELRYNRVRSEESSPSASSRATADLYALYTTIRF
ncbi:MAG: TlpA family protein disulfide reductase [Candidatus Latescibacterota bacterium]|jgi:peroxiredoxin|nr:MAG: TlpA family protein disulfide reductase [Candidatus Latescibacterota bacterium]